MKFLSARQDFEGNTLEAIASLLQKLQYLASLRDENGEYVHWGMARAHGESAAAQAIAEAHTELLLALLRAPLQELAAQLQRMDEEEGGAVGYIQGLLRSAAELAPKDLRGGSLTHLNSVLVGLAALSQARRASRPAS